MKLERENYIKIKELDVKEEGITKNDFELGIDYMNACTEYSENEKVIKR